MPRPPISPQRFSVRRRRVAFLALAVLLLLCAASAAFAQPPQQYRAESWTTADGLPQNSVHAILQTRDGYLWFTTLDGLVRFDGVRFKVFAKGDTAGINSNRFTALHEDKQGALWIGTEDGGVTRYRDGHFQTYTTHDGLPGNWVWALKDEPSGTLLLATRNGFARWDGDKFSALPIDLPADAGTIIWHHNGLGDLWSYARGGLWRMRADGSSAFVPLGDDTARLETLYEDHAGALWIATRDKRLRQWKAGRWTQFTARDGVPKQSVTAIYEDHRGELWLGTVGNGLSRFVAGKFVECLPAMGTTSEVVETLYQDREGTLWIGTRNRGLMRLRRPAVRVYTKQDGLSSNNVYPIYEDRRGDMWIGTWEGGLNKFRDGVFSRLSSPLPAGLPAASVTTFYEDNAGRLWIGAYNGLWRLEAGNFVEVTTRVGVGGLIVQVIRQDHAGNFWLGTNHGLFKYREEDGAHAAVSLTTEDGLAGDNVKDLLEDRQGRLWIATYGGLSCWRDGRLTTLTQTDGLSSDRLRTLHEDADGALWIGTYDNGLNRLKDKQLTRYTTRDGLFNNGVFRILEDDHDNFWMSCNRGLYRVSRRQLEEFAAGRIKSINCLSFGAEDGLEHTECNGGEQPAGWRARDGKLWFPTQGGVAVVDPAAVALNAQPPPVVLESYLLDREQVAAVPDAPLRIEPGRENLEINYTGLSFIRPEQVRFRYKLDGVDKDWVEAGTRRTAYYSHLAPGTYEFTVLAANSDGVWNTRGAALRVVVVPPFYRTWWFLALATLAVVGLAVLIYEARLVQLRRAHAAQEAFSRQLIDSQERERQRIAAELHDGLGQNLLVIKNWALLGLADGDGDDDGDDARRRAQLNEISATASQSIEEVRQIAYNLRPYQMDEIGLTGALKAMLRQVAAAAQLQVHAELDDLDGAFAKDTEINLYRIVQESLNNIIKHSGATEARVLVQRHPGELLVTVADDGCGFNSTPSAAAPTADGQPKHGGFGLTGIAERARMLGGKLLVQSQPGQGTTLTIRINLSSVSEEPNGNEH